MLLSFDGTQFHLICPQGDDLAVIQADHFTRERQEGREIGGNTGESFADAHHQPGTFFDGIKPVIIDSADNKSVITLQVAISQANCVDEVIPLVDVSFHGMHAGFAVILRANGHTFSDELLPQLHIIDHVTVMGTNNITI